MQIPKSGAVLPSENKEIPEMQNVIFNNPVFGKKELTRIEALDLINQLSMELMIDEKER